MIIITNIIVIIIIINVIKSIMVFIIIAIIIIFVFFLHGITASTCRRNSKQLGETTIRKLQERQRLDQEPRPLRNSSTKSSAPPHTPPQAKAGDAQSHLTR